MKYLLCLFFLFACENKKTKVESIAIIDYSYEGCFASGKSKIIIYKKDNEVFAETDNEDKSKLKAKLTNLQMDTFKIFIANLKNKNLGYGCTTKENYSVQYNNEVIEKVDSGCNWDGYSDLKNCLFSDTFVTVKIF
jgi:hypothetical protein